jgi:hypothetical protein
MLVDRTQTAEHPRLHIWIVCIDVWSAGLDRLQSQQKTHGEERLSIGIGTQSHKTRFGSDSGSMHPSS